MVRQAPMAFSVLLLFAAACGPSSAADPTLTPLGPAITPSPTVTPSLSPAPTTPPALPVIAASIDFELPRVGGGTERLASYKGKKNVVLVFYRGLF